MADTPLAAERPGRPARLLWLLAGLILPQLLLYGPSLIGQRILLPLDLLSRSYIHGVPAGHESATSAYVLSDQVLLFESWRQFNARELRAGRLPLWMPNIFCGTPFAVFPNYSPFQLPYIIFASPFVLAWLEVAKALVAGTGMYLFLRCVVQLSFWPAVSGAWCLPLTAYYLVWQGYYSTHTIPWLPWMLLATHFSITRPWGWGPILLALFSALTLISGQIDVALHILLTSGLYAVWLLLRAFLVCGFPASGGRDPSVGNEVSEPRLPTQGPRPPLVQRLRHLLPAALVTSIGWLAGFALAAPHLAPLLEYIPTGARMQERARGAEDRPPAGIGALAPLVLPDINGTHHHRSVYLGYANLMEGPAAGSAGILATLVLLPLAWGERRRWVDNFFWLGLAFFAVSWTLGVPGLVQLLRLPILNMMSHNRFVFVTSFCVLMLAATGLEVLRRGQLDWRVWLEAGTRSATRRWSILPLALVLPLGLLLLLGAWCSYRMIELPEGVLTLQDKDPDRGSAVAVSYRLVYARGIALSGVGLFALFYLSLGGARRRWWRPVLPLLLVGELLALGWDLNPQCDPTLYYPRVPVLETLKKAEPGRMLGVDCFPANVPALHGLHDLRGYDAVDPLLVMQVAELAQDPQSDNPSYARTQWYLPRYHFDQHGKIRLASLLDMLHIRYVVFRGQPPPTARPRWRFAGYWVMENEQALPRAFVPEQVQPAWGQETALKHLKQPDFDPRKVAYVDGEVSYPGPCRGQAEVIEEIPCRVTLQVNMATAGLVVLADTWAPGWRADLEGATVPVLRTNHMLRGVEVPAGRHRLTFTYDPASFRWGVGLCLAAAVVLLIWAVVHSGVRTPGNGQVPS